MKQEFRSACSGRVKIEDARRLYDGERGIRFTQVFEAHRPSQVTVAMILASTPDEPTTEGRLRRGE